MKRVIGIISLFACMAMLLCGCGNWKNYKSVQICSIQSDSTITFKMNGISGDMCPEGEEGWTYYYSDEKSKDEMLSELKEKNDYAFFTENGFNFIRVPNVNGVYFLNIYEEQVKLPDKIVDRTAVRIDDMGCWISDSDVRPSENGIYRFPFPYFMLQKGMDIYEGKDGLWLPMVAFDKTYNCDGAEFLNLVKTLGIWEVEEKENSFILSFKEDKIEVICGDGTVTLQPVSE